VGTSHTRYDGQIHAFFGMLGILDDADRATTESAEKLKAALA
jgi:hypothetical protein